MLVPMAGRQQALSALISGRIGAVVVRLSADALPQGVQIAIETDASPGRGFSVSAAISMPQRQRLRALFAKLSADPVGQKVLAVLTRDYLRPSSNRVYEGAETLLRGTWGY